jgi:hypothetical protein
MSFGLLLCIAIYVLLYFFFTISIYLCYNKKNILKDLANYFVDAELLQNIVHLEYEFFMVVSLLAHRVVFINIWVLFLKLIIVGMPW